MPKGSRKNTSRKQTKPKVAVTLTMSDTIDSETPSIVIKYATPSPSSKKTTPKRAPFQEPLPSPKVESIWDKVGMTEQEWKEHRTRVQKQLADWREEDQRRVLEMDWSTPDFWEERLKILEMLRAKYNKMGAWSTQVIQEVDKLDAAIAECEYELDTMFEEMDRLENMYD